MAAEAAAYSKNRKSFSLGLHLDLGEWMYRDGAWAPIYQVVPTDDAQAVKEELYHQLDTFRRLVGDDPTHIDSHQHVHRSEPTRSLLIEAAKMIGVPVRDINQDIKYCGEFYGQTGTGEILLESISVDALIKLLSNLQPGITELGCHPGLGDDLETMYRHERAIEVNGLCDPRVRAAIESEGIELCSFSSLPRARTFKEALHN
jgi:predicted glycoside hydrolase/deacetylase ChbG (UPF0249 family)